MSIPSANNIREFRRRWRRRKWNRRQKNKFASFQTLSRLFEPAQFVKCRRFRLELNSVPVSKRERKILGKPCCWHCRYCRCQLFVSYVFKRTGRLVTDNLRCFNSFWVSVLNNNRYGFSTIKKRLLKNWTAKRLGSRMCAVVVTCISPPWSPMNSLSLFHPLQLLSPRLNFLGGALFLLWPGLKNRKYAWAKKNVWVGPSPAGFPPTMILRVVQFGCTIPLWTTKGLTCKGAVTRIL